MLHQIDNQLSAAFEFGYQSILQYIRNGKVIFKTLPFSNLGHSPMISGNTSTEYRQIYIIVLSDKYP